ncbi:conserved hypothetical protein [Theileria orientalis strain Shintoku]|uniref:Trimethylguanosine synthase n=1 Tax=Theileria orientalis strain Shintoku TaxID=869250 RepID=J4D5S8_THEOR|nr:conserved hypothetical protein [Theileria orientalis strain Shintoku]BAM39155.1 conserved hypothetical protein [Theileria orientalis strain Shintoku]|eukprot:XP_009689456.1 conserved hypothetical protein [Theileria orientalis strain Shintoku]
MGGKELSTSSKKKKPRRTSSYSRVDGLEPNTLYLINLRYDFKRRRSIEGASETIGSEGNNSLDGAFSGDDGREKAECACVGEEYTGAKKQESNVEEPPDVNADNTRNLSKEEGCGEGEKMGCCKSHLCFVAVEYHCLKYDRTSCSDTYFNRDSPEYTSYVVGNIFLKRHPGLLFDEAALCDASWEVESVHLCNRIHSLLNAQSTGKGNTRSERSALETTASASTTNANDTSDSRTDDTAQIVDGSNGNYLVGGSEGNYVVDAVSMNDGSEANTTEEEYANNIDDTCDLDDEVNIEEENDTNEDKDIGYDSSSNDDCENEHSSHTSASEAAIHEYINTHRETEEQDHETETGDGTPAPNQPRRRDTRILDPFCGIGGNLVHFANNFDFSMGVELDKNRVEICENNLRVYEVSGTYAVINDDFFKFAEEFLEDPKGYFEARVGRPDLYRADGPQFDWVFLSPPWGGSNYKGSNNDETYVLEECFTQFYRCIELSSRLGRNVTLFLPRSQSIVEIVKAASLNDFKFILIDSYLTVVPFTKIRCCMIHLLNDVNMFNKNFKIRNVKRIHYTSSCSLESVKIMPIKNYVFDLNHVNMMKMGLLMLLNESSLNVYNKFSELFEEISVNIVLDLVNSAIETYHSNGKYLIMALDWYYWCSLLRPLALLHKSVIAFTFYHVLLFLLNYLVTLLYHL